MDAAATSPRAHPLSYAALRYFNVAGADPQGRAGQSSPNATHLIKIAVQAALGKRDGMDVFGTDYPTPDGSCVRDYVHVSDLVARASRRAALSARRRAQPHLQHRLCAGYSVLEVIDVVKRVSGVDFRRSASRARRAGDPAALVASNRARPKRCSAGRRDIDDLETIVRHALAWERRLLAAGRGPDAAPPHRGTAVAERHESDAARDIRYDASRICLDHPLNRFTLSLETAESSIARPLRLSIVVSI